MKDDNDILQSIGKKIWSVFPKNLSRIVFFSDSYPGNSGQGWETYSLSGERVPNGAVDFPKEILLQIGELVRDLQHTPPFDRQLFTHMRLELTDQGKMNVNFAYIPEWDSWPGVFMRGVSELTEEEARNPALSGTWGVDCEHWAECRARREREPYQK